MARRTAQTAQIVTPDGEEWRAQVPAASAPNGAGLPVLPPDDDEEREPGDRIAELIRESGVDSETSVRVYRRLPNSTKFAWCVNYTAGEFMAGDLGMIREQWGPGEYSLRVYGGQRGIIAREDVVIAPPSNPVAQPQGGVMQFPGQKTDIVQAIERMTEQNATILQVLSQRVDPHQQMMQSLEMMRMMREAMGLNVAPPPSVPPTSPTAVLGEVVAAVRAMREVSEEINPKAPDPENPMALLPAFLDVVKTAIGNRGDAAVPPVALPPSLAAPQPVDHQSNPISETENQDMGVLVMRGIMRESLAMKERGDSIEKVAEFLADKLPDEVLPYLDLPNWFEIAASFAPELKAHEQWVRDVASTALQMLKEPGPDSTAAG